MSAVSTAARPAPSRLRSWLELTRAANMFTAMSNIVAAQFIVAQGVPDLGPLLLLCAASACLYTGGIVLNDCFDFREDSAERPSRPLPSGRISLAAGFSVGFALLALGVACAALVGRPQALLALAIAAMVLIYDVYAKHTLAGPVAMAGCRLGNWLLGLSHGAGLAASWPIALPAFIYIMSLTVLSRTETRAERPTLLLLCGAGMLACAASIVALHAAGLLPHAAGLLFVAAWLAVVARRLGRTLRDFRPATIQASVKFLVLGMIPFDALMVLVGGPWWGAPCVLLLLVPSMLLARRIYVT